MNIRSLGRLGDLRLNFYRAHLIGFTVIPFGLGLIIYGVHRPANHALVDCLFLAYSAMTMTGLNTIPLADLNIAQQALLYVLMTIGSTTSISIIMIFIRLRFFRLRFKHHLATQLASKMPSAPFDCRPLATAAPPRLVPTQPPPLPTRSNSDSPFALPNLSFSPISLGPSPRNSFSRSFPPLPLASLNHLHHQKAIHDSPVHSIPQVEFLVDQQASPRRHSSDGMRHRRPRSRPGSNAQTHPLPVVTESPLHRKLSIASQKDFGGFPNPAQILTTRLIKWIRNSGRRTGGSGNELQFVRSASLQPQSGLGEKAVTDAERFWLGDQIQRVKVVSYITFNALVGRNSNFLSLTSAQEEELGGVEFRALSVLLKIVIAYWLLVPLLAIVLLWPALAADAGFLKIFQGQGGTNVGWYVIWITCSSFTNGGMSLIDAGFTVFQQAYLLILVTSFLILAGNTAFPVLLRLVIYSLSKMVPEGHSTREVLSFLLDHPRRCFVYLFPARHTWYLVASILALNFISWLSFLVLSIGTKEIEAIPIGTRILVGLLQSLSVRAAGFSVVSISALAPAIQVLYTIMMYIAVYPIAISIRSSNVYEERSLGIFDRDQYQALNQCRRASDATLDDSDQAQRDGNSWWDRPRSYLSVHARKQLAFDIWWLFMALWLICIIERSKITNKESMEWFNVFSIMFELVSAYGTIGLSLGVPFTSTSLCGQFSTLSKVIVILVMIRGRHRGLPIAIDRAVLIPSDHQTNQTEDSHEARDINEQRQQQQNHQKQKQKEQDDFFCRMDGSIDPGGPACVGSSGV